MAPLLDTDVANCTLLSSLSPCLQSLPPPSRRSRARVLPARDANECACVDGFLRVAGNCSSAGEPVSTGCCGGLVTVAHRFACSAWGGSCRLRIYFLMGVVADDDDGRGCSGDASVGAGVEVSRSWKSMNIVMKLDFEDQELGRSKEPCGVFQRMDFSRVPREIE